MLRHNGSPVNGSGYAPLWENFIGAAWIKGFRNRLDAADW